MSDYHTEHNEPVINEDKQDLNQYFEAFQERDEYMVNYKYWMTSMYGFLLQRRLIYVVEPRYTGTGKSEFALSMQDGRYNYGHHSFHIMVPFNRRQES